MTFSCLFVSFYEFGTSVATILLSHRVFIESRSRHRETRVRVGVRQNEEYALFEYL